MFDIHELTNSLPPARDDEPASLRQDIVDEILDHLQCGLRREILIKGDDENTAMQRVLERFGDPRQIAKKLWYQAMWSKIMTQRLVVGSTILSMVVSVCLVVMMSIGIQQMSRQQQVNAALFEQMSKLNLPRGDSPPRDLRWNNLKIKLTKGAKDGPPAVGFEIRVDKQPAIGEVAKNGYVYSAKTDDSGSSDCGYVEPAVFEVEITTPWHEQARVTFTVYPGRDHLEHIVVPEKIPEMTRVAFDSEETYEDLNASGAVLAVTFIPAGSRKITERTWTTREWLPGMPRPMLLIVPRKGIWISSIASTPQPGGLSTMSYTSKKGVWAKLETSNECQLPANNYRVMFDVVRVAENVSPDDSNWEMSMISSNSMLAVPSNQSMPFATRPFPDWRQPVHISAEVGKRNEWAILIPDEVEKCLAEPAKLGSGFF